MFLRLGRGLFQNDPTDSRGGKRVAFRIDPLAGVELHHPRPCGVCACLSIGNRSSTGELRGVLRRFPCCADEAESLLLIFCFLFLLLVPAKANDGGLIQNLVRMTTTRLLREDFEIMLPINQVCVSVAVAVAPETNWCGGVSGAL